MDPYRSAPRTAKPTRGSELDRILDSVRGRDRALPTRPDVAAPTRGASPIVPSSTDLGTTRPTTPDWREVTGDELARERGDGTMTITRTGRRADDGLGTAPVAKNGGTRNAISSSDARRSLDEALRTGAGSTGFRAPDSDGKPRPTDGRGLAAAPDDGAKSTRSADRRSLDDPAGGAKGDPFGTEAPKGREPVDPDLTTTATLPGTTIGDGTDPDVGGDVIINGDVINGDVINGDVYYAGHGYGHGYGYGYGSCFGFGLSFGYGWGWGSSISIGIGIGTSWGFGHGYGCAPVRWSWCAPVYSCWSYSRWRACYDPFYCTPAGGWYGGWGCGWYGGACWDPWYRTCIGGPIYSTPWYGYWGSRCVDRVVPLVVAVDSSSSSAWAPDLAPYIDPAPEQPATVVAALPSQDDLIATERADGTLLVTTPTQAWRRLAYGEVDAALDAFAALVSERPDQIEHLVGYALGLAMQERFELAALAMREAVVRDPQSLLRVPMTAELNDRLVRTEVDLLLAARSNDGAGRDAVFLLASIRTLVGDLPGARAALGVAIAEGDRSGSTLALGSYLGVN